MPATTNKGIRARDAVRNAFAARSTGSTQGAYYSTKGHAVNAFDAELQTYGYAFDRSDLWDMPGEDGDTVFRIVDADGDCVGFAKITWYRMPSGRYEFVGYIA